MSGPDGTPARAVPVPTPDSRPYWDGLAAGELRLPRCRPCDRPFFYPRSGCPACGSTDIEWMTASGRGRLHTYLISHLPAPGFGPEPYAIAVVELEEGPRMMSNVVGVPNTPEALVLDMELEVVFEQQGTVTVPRFRPVGVAS